MRHRNSVYNAPRNVVAQHYDLLRERVWCCVMPLQLPTNLERQIIELANSYLRPPTDVLAELVTEALRDRRTIEDSIQRAAKQTDRHEWADSQDSVAKLLADMKM
jgi:hypothetical protein